MTKVEDNLLKQCGHNQPGSNSSIARLEETFLKRCACGHVPDSQTASCKKCVRIQTPEEQLEELFFKGKDGKTASNEGLVFYV